MNQYDLVPYCATHTAQHLPKSVKEDALVFMAVVVPKCAERPCLLNFMINMDQTNVYFKQLPKTTINVHCAQTIHMRQGADDSKHSTVAFITTALVWIITPMILYQGIPGGKIDCN
jgi:hypothetical protein